MSGGVQEFTDHLKYALEMFSICTGTQRAGISQIFSVVDYFYFLDSTYRQITEDLRILTVQKINATCDNINVLIEVGK